MHFQHQKARFELIEVFELKQFQLLKKLLDDTELQHHKLVANDKKEYNHPGYKRPISIHS